MEELSVPSEVELRQPLVALQSNINIDQAIMALKAARLIVGTRSQHYYSTDSVSKALMLKLLILSGHQFVWLLRKPGQRRPAAYRVTRLMLECLLQCKLILEGIPTGRIAAH